jgi:protein-disulfide isomerase-like protein with CxxC motif
MTPIVDVVELTDAGCAWPWGAEPVLRWLQHAYGENLRWRRVQGVQIDRAPDAEPKHSPEVVRERWMEIAGHTGAPVPTRLNWAIGSSHVAARAAKAAERQSNEIADGVLRALREAAFVYGRPADTPQRIADALVHVPGLDLDRLLVDLRAHDVMISADADYGEARRPHPDVILLHGPGPHPGAAKRDGDHQRYAFPTLVFHGRRGVRLVPGWREPAVYRQAVEAVEPALADAKIHPLDPAQALARWGSVTEPELKLLCGRRDPPPGAAEVRTATSSLWIDPERSRGSSARALAEVSR